MSVPLGTGDAVGPAVPEPSPFIGEFEMPEERPLVNVHRHRSPCPRPAFPRGLFSLCSIHARMQACVILVYVRLSFGFSCQRPYFTVVR